MEEQYKVTSDKHRNDPFNAQDIVEQLDAFLQDALTFAEKIFVVKRELDDTRAQVTLLKSENKDLRGVLEEQRSLYGALVLEFNQQEDYHAAIDKATKAIFDAEQRYQTKMQAEYHASQRIQQLESHIRLLQAEKAQLKQLTEQLMHQKLQAEDKLRDAALHQPRNVNFQDIQFYKSKCIQLQEENAILRQAQAFYANNSKPKQTNTSLQFRKAPSRKP